MAALLQALLLLALAVRRSSGIAMAALLQALLLLALAVRRSRGKPEESSAEDVR
ncbi:UNVERIFIED_CONTAM: hypothetical protein FKN15_060612 [Acipenser sinensis]